VPQSKSSVGVVVRLGVVFDANFDVCSFSRQRRRAANLIIPTWRRFRSARPSQAVLSELQTALDALDEYSKNMIKVSDDERRCTTLLTSARAPARPQLATRQQHEQFLAAARQTTRAATTLLERLNQTFGNWRRQSCATISLRVCVVVIAGVARVASAGDALRTSVRNAVHACRSADGSAFMSGVDLDAAIVRLLVDHALAHSLTRWRFAYRHRYDAQSNNPTPTPTRRTVTFDERCNVLLC
jgi:hypothetical protein